MPNHVFNEVRLHGVSLEKVTPLISREDVPIDFSVLLPMPINYWRHSRSVLHEKGFPGSWYEWNRENWGTKWNAYGFDQGGRYESVSTDERDTVLRFQTAWSTPRGWLCAMFNTLNCQITVEYLDEGSVNGGRETFTPEKSEKMCDEARWGTEEIPEGTDEHRRLHKLLWGVEEFTENDDD